MIGRLLVFIFFFSKKEKLIFSFVIALDQTLDKGSQALKMKEWGAGP